MNYDKIDGYLVDIFNNVVIIEEASLKNSKFNDVSLKEMHTIDVIGTHPDTTPSAVAKELLSINLKRKVILSVRVHQLTVVWSIYRFLKRVVWYIVFTVVSINQW